MTKAPSKKIVKRAVKLVVTLVFFAGAWVWDRLRRLRGAKPASPSCVIVYYHSVPENEKERFIAQLNMLVRMTTPIDIERPPVLQPGVRYSCVTFDDGFESVAEHALPELQKRNVPAILLIAAGWMGKPAEWWPEPSPERKEKIMSAEQLRSLPRETFSFGSHTLTHPMLTQLSEADARREIQDSRSLLQDALGCKINLISFPYGDFNQQTVELCRQAGYGRVLTTLPGAIALDRPEFVLGRVKVEPFYWNLEFRLKLLDAYRWQPRFFELRRRLLAPFKGNPETQRLPVSRPDAY